MRELFGEFGYLSNCMPYGLEYPVPWHRRVWFPLSLDGEFPEAE